MDREQQKQQQQTPGSSGNVDGGGAAAGATHTERAIETLRRELQTWAAEADAACALHGDKSRACMVRERLLGRGGLSIGGAAAANAWRPLCSAAAAASARATTLRAARAQTAAQRGHDDRTTATTQWPHST